MPERRTDDLTGIISNHNDSSESHEQHPGDAGEHDAGYERENRGNLPSEWKSDDVTPGRADPGLATYDKHNPNYEK